MIKAKKTMCKDCCYCKMTHRASGRKGRGNYYCQNPAAEKLPQKAFGNKSACFICFGTAGANTQPQIKTRPRWCPLSDQE